MATEARAAGSAEAGTTARTETIFSAMATAAGERPDHPFLHDGGETISYAGLREESEEMASRLAGLGVGAGERVVLWLPNGRTWAALFFACARIGALAVMAGTRLRAVDLRHILEDSRATTLVWSPSFLGIDYDGMVESILRGAVGERPQALANLLTDGAGRTPGAKPLETLSVAGLPAVAEDGEAPAVVCYTSGTTGLPKGCVHSHSSLLRNGRVAVGLTGLGEDDRIVCPVPFAHVFGFHMGVLQGALAGATVVNAEPYTAARLLDLTASHEGTVLYAVPAMAQEVVALQAREPRDLSSLRTALVAGAPVSARLRRAVADPVDGLGAAVSVVYGCTEAPTLTQLPPGPQIESRLASVGRPTPGIELSVCRPGSRTAMGSGETGEILARGYNRMLGYLGDDAATAARLRGEWLVTGDLGWLDEDGYLHFVGRAGEMFTVGGFNAYPREIAAQLEEVEGLVEVAVTGVPDERLGSVPMAWVTVDEGGPGEQEILAWSGEQMASYKRPRYVRVVDSLPRTPTGKISQVKLERLARRALPALAWEAER